MRVHRALLISCFATAVAVTRPSTKGPLEEEDDAVDEYVASHISASGFTRFPSIQHADLIPFSSTSPLSATTSASRTTSASASATTSTPTQVLSPTLASATPSTAFVSPAHDANDSQHLPAKDFSYLLNPQSYHILPPTSTPPPFQNAPQPALNTPLPSLLQTAHYRLAALSAARTLCSTPPTDHSTIFHLLHIRLSCLCLIGEHTLAAQESKLLGDLTSTFYRHPVTNVHLVPWSLRVLCVRLAALGYGEWRKGIMGYYELAKEARENAVKAASPEEKALWKARLRECGIRVANVLVEMGELEGAGGHLRSLSKPEGEGTSNTQEAREVLFMETLVWLRVGDIKAAKQCLSAATALPKSDDKISATLNALIALADSDYDTSASLFRDLHNKYPEDAMITQNLAVALLYLGHISDARELLIELVDQSSSFHSLVFNLCTIFELCSERHREKKLALAEKLAGRVSEQAEVGWELGNADFKL